MRIHPLLRRLLRRLGYDWPGEAFDLNFCDRAAAQAVFQEDTGSLLTDGTRSCQEPAHHLLYDQELDSSGGRRGLLVLLDDQNIDCGHGAEIAVGHLTGESLSHTHTGCRNDMNSWHDVGQLPNPAICVFDVFVVSLAWLLVR